MNDFDRVRTRQLPRPRATTDVVGARTPAPDAVGTACWSQGRLRCVVVHDVARLARSAPILEAILRTFREAGVECVPITEGTRDA